jgi:hypothetical protein
MMLTHDAMAGKLMGDVAAGWYPPCGGDQG